VSQVYTTKATVCEHSLIWEQPDHGIQNLTFAYITPDQPPRLISTHKLFLGIITMNTRLSDSSIQIYLLKYFIQSILRECSNVHESYTLIVTLISNYHFRLISWTGRKIDPVGVDYILQKLGFHHARTTIPKWLQRGVMDPLDKVLSVLIKKLGTALQDEKEKKGKDKEEH
jgi:hypothetical protein